MRGADAIAVRDRGQPLHRRAEQPAECLGLRLAQLRELGGHVGDRAVVLAELLSPPPAALPSGAPLADAAYPSADSASARACTRTSAAAAATTGRYRFSRSATCLRANSVTASGPADLGEEAQRTGGQVVVGVLERARARHR